MVSGRFVGSSATFNLDLPSRVINEDPVEICRPSDRGGLVSLALGYGHHCLPEHHRFVIRSNDGSISRVLATAQPVTFSPLEH